MMPKQLRETLRNPDTRPPNIAGYEIECVLGHGYKGITFRVRQTHGPKTPYALKLTIAEEYTDKTFLPEVDSMAELALADRDHFPQIHHCDYFDFVCDGVLHRLVYFIEEFVKGSTLEGILRTSPESLNATFLYNYTSEMLSALATMQACKLMHDDLHAGNVILIDRSPRRPILIDFGSVKARGVTKKSRDDIRNLASHIAAIANAIQQYTPVRTSQEDRILLACESLLAFMSDDDPMRRPDDAHDLEERFASFFSLGSLQQVLKHPFDFGNAEEVMDNSLLYSLSAKSFPWRAQMEASSHLLVIGPRGSGKTTVFRSMSFKCLSDAKLFEDAISRTYVGLYISCNREFRQRFSAIDPELLTRRQDDIRHYLHLVILREFVTTLGVCNINGNLLEAETSALREFIRSHTMLLNAVPPDASPEIGAIEAIVTREVSRCRMALWNDQDIEGLTSQGFIADLAAFATKSIGAFLGKTLYLFVDDYTEGKVPKEAQRALNHILFVPNSSYKCKISSEVFGVALDETYGNFLTQDRDYKEWNLGTEYCVNLPTIDQKSFLKEIVDNRLRLCNYSGRVDTVIGNSKYAGGTLARTLKREAEIRREKKRAKKPGPQELVDRMVQREVEDEGFVAEYHGWDTICDLCTGDVSNILELLNRMYEECGVKSDTEGRITPQQQSSVIEGYSRQYISKIKGIPVFGERLFAIVDAFGNMARQLLQEHPGIDRGPNRKDPYQVLRIELDEAGNVDPESDSGRIWKLLQRYCIFIDAEEGRSRRNTLSSRVLLRRIFCPVFRMSLTNSESWTISRQKWEAFCNDPKRRAEAFVGGVLESTSTSDRPQQTFGFLSQGLTND